MCWRVFNNLVEISADFRLSSKIVTKSWTFVFVVARTIRIAAKNRRRVAHYFLSSVQYLGHSFVLTRGIPGIRPNVYKIGSKMFFGSTKSEHLLSSIYINFQRQKHIPEMFKWDLWANFRSILGIYIFSVTFHWREFGDLVKVEWRHYIIY